MDRTEHVGRRLKLRDLQLLEAVVRWDPAWHAERELAERVVLGFPPAVRVATVTGSAPAVRQLVQAAELPDGAEVLGPVPIGTDERAVIRIGAERGLELTDALRAAQGARSARKDRDPVRVQIDPLDLV